MADLSKIFEEFRRNKLTIESDPPPKPKPEKKYPVGGLKYSVILKASRKPPKGESKPHQKIVQRPTKDVDKIVRILQCSNCELKTKEDIENWFRAKEEEDKAKLNKSKEKS